MQARIVLTGIVVCGMILCSRARAVLVYAADVQNEAGGTAIVTFDSANPAGTIHLVGHSGIGSNFTISGLDFDRDGTLYASTQIRGTGQAAGSLYTINQTTGQATLRGGYGTPDDQIMTDLTYNPATNQLMGVAFDGTNNFLYTIDSNNGHATLVGQINRPGAIFLGICASSNGTVYLQGAFGQMYTLSGLDAIATSQSIGVSTIFPNGMTMDWAHDGKWYLAATYQIGSTLNARGDMRLINIATGRTQQILGAWPQLANNSYPVYGIADIAIDPTPEPTIVVPALLLLVFIRRRPQSG